MKNKLRNSILIIANILCVLLTAYFVLGYINFKRIEGNKKPYLIADEIIYQKENANVTVYNGIVYKIVKYEMPSEYITLRLKLWFNEDI